MKRLLFILALLALTCQMTTAQDDPTPPDYKQIRSKIQNTKGPESYNELMRRYNQNDTTLLLDHYRTLYFGYTMREDYVPYQRSHLDLLDIRKRIVDTKGEKSVCSEAIPIAKRAIEDNPFDLVAISTLAFSYDQLNDTTAYKLWNDKKISLLDAINSTGDGMEEKTAYHVIDLEHEYEMLMKSGLIVESDSLCNENVEYLRVKQPNAEDIRGIYFNFGACRQVYRKKYE